MADIIVPDLDDDNGAVNFVVRRRQIEGFIRSMVGARRSDRMEFNGVLRIKKADIAIIYEKIRQYVEGQYEAVVTAASISVRYDKIHERNYEDIEVFISSDEAVSKNAREITVSMSFLISFPGEESPVKQDVSIVFSTVGVQFPSTGSIKVIVYSRNSMWLSAMSSFLKENMHEYVKEVRVFWLPKLFNWLSISWFYVILLTGINLSGISFNLSPDPLDLRPWEVRRLEGIVESGLTDHQSSLLERMKFVGGVGDIRREIDDARRLDYVNKIKEEKTEFESARVQLGEVRKEKKKIEEQAGPIAYLKIVLKNSVFLIFVAISCVVTGLFLYARIIEKYNEKRNVSYIWLKQPREDPDRLRISDFSSATAMSVIVGFAVSSVFFVLSLMAQ